MASTRNKNCEADYLQEQRCNNENYLYRTYEHSQYGKPDCFLNKFKLPDNTLATRAVSNDCLSYNPVEIESFLKGISATNLTEPKKKINAQLKQYESVKMYDRVPLLLPKQITTDQGQRPLLWEK